MLELSSNTIKTIGIFGRMSSHLEQYFDSIEAKYSKKPDKELEYDIFRHHTLTFVSNATVTDIQKQFGLSQRRIKQKLLVN